MTDKKLTDEEIIKRLERCVKRGNRNYDTDIVLDLINRQKSEIGRLQKEVNLVSILFQDEQERAEEYRLKIENLQNVISNQQIEISVKIENKIKAEAYKEFAKRLNEEIEKAYNNNSSVLREHLERHKEKPDFEIVAAIQGKMNALRGLDDFIDNLLKEMVGEEE